tara:strand:- start:1791 stop:3434 length:1644 start_codon:yes stop_codon:yes gene_type:complete
MNIIVLSIKNIIKTNFALSAIILSVLFCQEYSNDSIDKKQKSLNEIDSEIISLEKKLKSEINNAAESEQKIQFINDNIKKERVNISEKRYEKEQKQKLLDNAILILDSLDLDLKNIKDSKSDVEKIINKLNISNKEIDYKIKVINDSIKIVNQKISNTSNDLDIVKQKTKKIVIETLTIKSPSEIEFMLASENWDMFIINSNLYESLIESQKTSFDELIKKYENISKQLIQDSLMKQDLYLDKNNLIGKLNDYKKQLKNFNTYKSKLDILIDEKKNFVDLLTKEYQQIGLDLNDSKDKILSLEQDLEQLTKKNNSSIETQEKIKSQIAIKQKARESIRTEILKLIENAKKYDGLDFTKLKGQLPWPIDGKIITKFGKHTNPDTKVVINYDLIEIQPNMSKEEKIILLAKQINPSSPNEAIVKKFQNMTMNLKSGDRGYGVFGPQTTKKWKQYNKMQFLKEDEPVYAIYNGIVESINFVNPIVGVVIIINHGNDYFSVYNGNIEVSVMEGSEIKTSQKIGSIEKKNVLSFQLWKNNTPINPEKWFMKK